MKDGHMRSVEYHLRELKISLDKNDDKRVLPNILDSDKAILDIGCGIGQSFIALGCTDRICVGLDIDEDAVRYGAKHYGSNIHFILANAENIPLPSNTFHLVFSRVALPYTNIPVVIKEMRRVLMRDGKIWLTLHSKDMAKQFLLEAISSLSIKRLIHVIYILLNGYLFKYFGIVFPFVNGSYESWQDISAINSLLTRNGFKVDVHKVDGHTVVQGTLI